MKRTFREPDGIDKRYEGPGVLVRPADFFGDGGDQHGLDKKLDQVVAGMPHRPIEPWGIRDSHGDVPDFFKSPFSSTPPIEVLRRRLRDLELEDSEAGQDFQRDSLRLTAAALVWLDRSATDAAGLLIRLFDDVEPALRRGAIEDAADLFLRHGGTDATASFRAAFEHFLTADDNSTFVRVAHILAAEHFEAVHLRCAGLLDNPSYELRQRAALALARTPAPNTAEALATLAGWAPRGEPIGLALWVGAMVGATLPECAAVALVRRGLAAEPATTRLQALDVATKIRSGMASVLEEALRDEPEPALQEKIRAELGKT